MNGGTKQCKKCWETKPVTDFYAMKGMKDGHRNDCKLCNQAARKARYDADPKKYIGFVKRWQQENSEKVLAYQREYRRDPVNKRKGRDGHLKRKFGISVDEYDRMLDAQGGGRAIGERRRDREPGVHRRRPRPEG